MDFQALLQQEASSRKLTLTTLSSVSAMLSSQKVACCGGLVEKIVAESAQDCTVLLRDVTGTVHCGIHGALSNRYPDALSTGALLLFRDVTVLVTSTLMPPILVVCLEHLAALLLPEGPPGNTRSFNTGYTAVTSSSSFPLAESMMQIGESIRVMPESVPSPPHCGYVNEIHDKCLGSEAAVAAHVVSSNTGLVSLVELGDDDIYDGVMEDGEEESLVLADDL